MKLQSKSKQILNSLLLIALVIWLAMSMPKAQQPGFLMTAAAVLSVLGLISLMTSRIKNRRKKIPKSVHKAAELMGRATILLDQDGEVLTLNHAAISQMEKLSARYGDDLFDRVLATKAQWIGKPQAEISANLDEQILNFSISGISQKTEIIGYWVALRISKKPTNAMNEALRNNAQLLQQKFNIVNQQMPAFQRRDDEEGTRVHGA